MNPNVDWGATLAGLSQLRGETNTAGGTSGIPLPLPEIPPTTVPPTTIPTLSMPVPDELPQKETKPSETPKPSPEQTQIEPLDVSLLSAYHDPGTEDEENTEAEKETEEEAVTKEKESGEGVEKKEEMLIATGGLERNGQEARPND